MKKIGKMLLLATLLILLVGVACAAEAPDNTIDSTSDATVAEQTSTVSQSDTQENLEEVKTDETSTKTINKKKVNNINTKKDTALTVNSWQNLVDTVDSLNDAKTNVTIKLNKTGDYTINSTITWKNSNPMVLTIDGNGEVMKGNDNDMLRIFFGCSLIMKNLTVTNYIYVTESVIYNNGNLTIVNCTFKDNNDSTSNSVIKNNLGYLIINDSSFINNRVRGTHNSRGLTIENSETLIINNCTFEDNVAQSGVGAIYNSKNMNITLSRFNNNTAIVGSGGAISNKGNTIIKDSNLTNNNAYKGGAIYNLDGNITISNSNLTHNNATYDGGAIYINNGSVTISNGSMLKYNTALGYVDESDEKFYGGYGGAIYNLGNLNITRATLNNNSASIDGGAVYSDKGKTIIEDSTLNNNTAQRVRIYIGSKIIIHYGVGGALYNYDNGTMKLTGINLTYNKAGDYGGAIENYGNMTITNSNITHNNARYGGAMENYGNMTITNSNITHNNATYGGAVSVYNAGKLTIINSTLKNNNATRGGAISIDGNIPSFFNVTGSIFEENTANETAAISHSRNDAIIFITSNKFTRNTAENNETLKIRGSQTVENNNYDSTDISLKTINLTATDNKEVFQYGEDIKLNFSIELTNPNSYDENILKKLNKTIYINNKKNTTTDSNNYNIPVLKPGKYTVYYETCNQKSNTATFKVICDSEISTDKESYDYYEGIKNKIQMDINDESQQHGTVDVSVKDGDKYIELLTYHNVKDGHNITTATLAKALTNLYEDLDSSYTINITYHSDYANPSSTEFTLNIIRQRNTSIIYDILNNTEKNVQISIAVIDTIYKTPISSAKITVTGDITRNTTTGTLTDNTLTKGNHKIIVNYDGTENYKASNATIIFTVEIDKNAKIAQLETENKELTGQIVEAKKEIKSLQDANNALAKKISDANRQLEEANKQIKTLNTTNKKLTEQLKAANKKIKTLNATINSLKKQLSTANKKIKTLNNTVNSLNKQLSTAQKEIKTLNNTINNLTKQLNKAQKEIQELKDYIKKITTKSKTSITINHVKSSVGSIATITANIKDKNNKKVNEGQVIFKVNGITLKDKNENTIYAQVKNGKATIKYKVQYAWMKNNSYIEAVYAENDRYTTSRTNSTKALKITPGTAKITLEQKNIKTKAGQTITLKAKIVDKTGERINNGKVAFKLNGKTLKDKNGNVKYAKVKDGTAKIKYKLPDTYCAKTYNLTAVFGGGNYKQAKANGKLVIEKKAVEINITDITTKNHKTTIKARIIDENGKLLVKNTKLAVKINKKTVLTGVYSNKGKISLSFTTTLKPGSYELLIISGENGIYKTGKITTVLKT